jgi:hypothetical protein
MFRAKPAISSFQEFGVEAWLHRRVHQSADKFD